MRGGEVMEDTIIEIDPIDIEISNNFFKEQLLVSILADQIEILATWNREHAGEVEQIERVWKNIELINVLAEKIKSLWKEV